MSTGVLIDSCLFIEHMRSREKTRSTLNGILARFDRPFISTVIEYEVAVGGTELHAELWASILRRTTVLTFDSFCVKAACEIKRKLAAKRGQIDLADLFIAATALAYGLPLATLNRKHFERVDGLELVRFPILDEHNPDF